LEQILPIRALELQESDLNGCWNYSHTAFTMTLTRLFIQVL
jgi:hypothetical protein